MKKIKYFLQQQLLALNNHHLIKHMMNNIIHYHHHHVKQHNSSLLIKKFYFQLLLRHRKQYLPSYKLIKRAKQYHQLRMLKHCYCNWFTSYKELQFNDDLQQRYQQQLRLKFWNNWRNKYQIKVVININYIQPIQSVTIQLMKQKYFKIWYQLSRKLLHLHQIQDDFIQLSK